MHNRTSALQIRTYSESEASELTFRCLQPFTKRGAIALNTRWTPNHRQFDNHSNNTLETFGQAGNMNGKVAFFLVVSLFLGRDNWEVLEY